jgi:hypothetical protein
MQKSETDAAAAAKSAREAVRRLVGKQRDLKDAPKAAAGARPRGFVLTVRVEFQELP